MRFCDFSRGFLITTFRKRLVKSQNLQKQLRIQNLKSRFLHEKYYFLVRIFFVSAYRPVLAENGLYLISGPTAGLGPRKNFKSVQLRPFFWRAPHMQRLVFLKKIRMDSSSGKRKSRGFNLVNSVFIWDFGNLEKK